MGLVEEYTKLKQANWQLQAANDRYRLQIPELEARATKAESLNETLLKRIEILNAQLAEARK